MNNNTIKIVKLFLKFYPVNKVLIYSPEKHHAVVQRYLKGVSIADLALQFNCPHQIIEQILFNKGIEIVKKKAFKKKRY